MSVKQPLTHLARRSSASSWQYRFFRHYCFMVPVVFLGIAVGVPSLHALQKAGDVDEEYPNPQTALLELYVGPWTVVETHLNATGQVIATVHGTEEVSWILDRRAIRRVYITKREDSPFRAEGIVVWNDAEKSYDGVWLNNTATLGFVSVTGAWSAQSRTLTFSVTSRDAMGRVEKHKTVEQFVDDKTRVATTYRMDGPKMTKTTEVRFVRSTPCPDKLRIIFDQ